MTAPARTGRGRHAASRVRGCPAGPVTVALQLASKPHVRPVAVALRAWPVLFTFPLARPALAGSPLLGDYAGQVLGFDATLCLLATLLVTPLITVTRCNAARLRWWYGVWMFTLGFFGLAITLTVAPGTIGDRAAGTAVNWTGTLLVVLLLPAAVMSNKACQKLMGPEWKRWQRQLVWWVWALVLGHVLLLHDLWAASGFLAFSAPLIALRVPSVRRGVKAWRQGGYETQGWWVAMEACAVLLITGVSILLALEVQAVARALTLSPL